jgi:hypothetical protein
MRRGRLASFANAQAQHAGCLRQLNSVTDAPGSEQQREQRRLLPPTAVSSHSANMEPGPLVAQPGATPGRQRAAGVPGTHNLQYYRQQLAPGLLQQWGQEDGACLAVRQRWRQAREPAHTGASCCATASAGGVHVCTVKCRALHRRVQAGVNTSRRFASGDVQCYSMLRRRGATTQHAPATHCCSSFRVVQVHDCVQIERK